MVALRKMRVLIILLLLTAILMTGCVLAQYTLSTTASPDGSGTISPASGSYDVGTEVTLTATPTEGYVFDHWGGDATGTSSSVTLTMDSAKSVTAHFKGRLIIIGHEVTRTIDGIPTLRGQVKNFGDYDYKFQIVVNWYDNLSEWLMWQESPERDIGPGETQNFELEYIRFPSDIIDIIGVSRYGVRVEFWVGDDPHTTMAASFRSAYIDQSQPVDANGDGVINARDGFILRDEANDYFVRKIQPLLDKAGIQSDDKGHIITPSYGAQLRNRLFIAEQKELKEATDEFAKLKAQVDATFKEAVQ